MKYNKQYGQFLVKMGKMSGQASLCESIHDAYKACCEASDEIKPKPLQVGPYTVEGDPGGIYEIFENGEKVYGGYATSILEWLRANMDKEYCAAVRARSIENRRCSYMPPDNLAGVEYPTTW